jgi:subtilase family serine protease
MSIPLLFSNIVQIRKHTARVSFLHSRFSSWIATSIGVVLLLGTIQVGSAAEMRILHGHVPPAIARLHLQPVGRLPAAQRLNLAIGLPLRNQEALTNLLQQICNPASPKFRHYLTPEEFTEQFGPAESDYTALISFVRSNGFTVMATHPNRTLLDVNGSVADIEKIFHITLRTYQHPKEARTFYAPDIEPSVDLAVPILHINGLDDFTLPHPANLKKKMTAQTQGATPNLGSGPGESYIGNDFRAAYVPGVSLDGSGQTVGLLQFDGYYASDITNYEAQAGLTNDVVLTNVLLDSFDGTPGDNADEVSLDIEMVVSMAPGAGVIVYEAGPNGIPNDILNRMATDNLAKQLSSSWTWSPYDPATEQIFQQFAAQGQTYFNASGDDDAYTGAIPTPADDPNITIVGGTTLSTTGPGGSWQSETVWNWNSGTGSSGGISTIFSIPDWQQGIDMTANQGSTTMRNIPDVALTADNVYVTYGNGSSETVGGTSCATPLWAAFTALVNQQAVAAGQPTVGFINPTLYEIGRQSDYTSNFHDVTTGNNFTSGSSTEFTAVTGYDLCTGWGTPNGQNLINSLATPDPLAISPAGGFTSQGPFGGPFSASVQNFSLTNSGGTSLNWSLADAPSWLNVSPSSGTLTPGGIAVTVTASLNSAAASLPAGMYVAAMTFSNLTSGIGHNRLFILQVNDSLTVSPTTGFTANGPVGGPFNLTSQIFLLGNSAAGSLDWSVATASPWFSVFPAGGTLANGQTATVTVALAPQADGLPAGIYTASLIFSNLTSGLEQTRPLVLSVGQSLVQNGGFETGDFSFWTLTDNGGPDFVDNGSEISPHSGDYVAALGQADSVAHLSQTLQTIPGQSYLLSFWLINPVAGKSSFGNREQFLVNWNTNTTSINTIFNQMNPGAFDWTNQLFVVTATGTNAVLQFGSRNDPWYFGLDDVSVQPIPVPSFQSIVETSNAFVLSWNSLAGIQYQLQYSTNLAQTNWFILSTNVATDFITAFTNVIGTDPQQFYRVRRLP